MSDAPSTGAEISTLLSGVHFVASSQVVNLGQPFHCSGSQLLALEKQNKPKGRLEVEAVKRDCIFNRLLDFSYLIT